MAQEEGSEAPFVTRYRIPFNKPALVGHELKYMEEACRSGHLSGDGPFTKRCSEFLEQALGSSRAFLTTSCTHALEMSALLLEFEPGDEVIVPSFGFVTTAGAFVLRGAKPVFADVRPDTLNLDEALLRDLITPRTKAIVPLHYAGVGCEMDEIMSISNAAGVPVVEDNAQGLFGTYKGRPLGSFGALSTTSFHETKNFSAGEGGALFVGDPRFSRRAEILREKGTDRSRFFRGEIDKYSWVDLGSSYLPSELIAAYLWAQFEAREAIQAKRKELWGRYAQELSDWSAKSGVELPSIPDHCGSTDHIFYLILPSLEARTALIGYLKARGILAVFHYLPLHLSEMGRRFGGREGQCPVSEDRSERLLRLPLYHDLSLEEQDQVIDAIVSFEVC